MLRFPYPVKFVAANKKEFNVRVTKPNKRSWWLQLLDDNKKVVKTIKVTKTSPKLRYPTQNGGLANGAVILKSLLKERARLEPYTPNNRQTNRESATHT